MWCHFCNGWRVANIARVDAFYGVNKNINVSLLASELDWNLAVTNRKWLWKDDVNTDRIEWDKQPVKVITTAPCENLKYKITPVQREWLTISEWLLLFEKWQRVNDGEEINCDSRCKRDTRAETGRRTCLASGVCETALTLNAVTGKNLLPVIRHYYGFNYLILFCTRANARTHT